MKRILVFVVLIFTMLSSGMFHIVLHVCTSSEREEIETNTCCQSKSKLPKCCKAENKIEVEPSFCCSNIQFYYITPKFNDGFKKILNIPLQPYIELLDQNQNFSFNQNIQYKQISDNHQYPPPNPFQEKICVWII